MNRYSEGLMASNVVPIPRTVVFKREPFLTIQPGAVQWLVKDLIPSAGYGFLVGASGSRKSFLALEWGLRIASGEDVLGHRSRQGGVVYVAAEGAAGVRKRVAAWRQVNGGADRAFELIGQAPDLRNPVQIEDLLAELKTAAGDHAANGEGLRLVVIDTLAASMPGGDENNSGDMSALLANIQRIASEAGAFVLVISHTGKDETRGIRGWSGQTGNADLIVMLTKDEESGLTEGVVKKLKDAEDGERFAYRLESVVLGQDDEGDDIGSCVIIYEEALERVAKKRAPRPLKPDYAVLLRAIQQVTDYGVTTPVSASIPGAKSWQKGVSRTAVKARAMEIGFEVEGEKPDTCRQRFSRGLQDLASRNLIRLEGDLIWLLSVTA